MTILWRWVRTPELRPMWPAKGEMACSHLAEVLRPGQMEAHDRNSLVLRAPRSRRTGPDTAGVSAGHFSQKSLQKYGAEQADG